jgi:hypothetical protein
LIDTPSLAAKSSTAFFSDWGRFSETRAFMW